MTLDSLVSRRGVTIGVLAGDKAENPKGALANPEGVLCRLATLPAEDERRAMDALIAFVTILAEWEQAEEVGRRQLVSPPADAGLISPRTQSTVSSGPPEGGLRP